MLLKNCLCRTCLPHKFPDFERHLVENPIFFFLDCPSSFPSTIFLHPSRSFIQRHLLLNSWFIWSKFQLLVIALITLGDVRLYVNTSGILLLRFLVFSSKSFCLSKVLVLSIRSFISCLYPLSTSLLRNLSQLPRIHYLLIRCGGDTKLVQMVYFALKTQGVLIYDINRPADWILSCRVWLKLTWLCFINDS